MPSPRAHLRKDARRRIALPIVVHPPADGLATLPHSAGMRRPRTYLHKDSLRRISPPKAPPPPTGNLPRRPQSAGMQIPRADRAELPLRRLRLPIVEHVPPKTAGPPALDRAVALAHRAGEMPAHGNIAERARRRVRIPTPAGDPAVCLADRAVVPFPGADRRVPPLRNLKQLRVSAAPAVDAAGDVQSAGVVASCVERDVAVCRSGRGGLRESQEREQQRADRQPDQEGFTPPPPDRVSAAAARQARWATVRKSAMCVTPATLHQRRIARACSS